MHLSLQHQFHLRTGTPCGCHPLWHHDLCQPWIGNDHEGTPLQIHRRLPIRQQFSIDLCPDLCPFQQWRISQITHVRHRLCRIRQRDPGIARLCKQRFLQQRKQTKHTEKRDPTQAKDQRALLTQPSGKDTHRDQRGLRLYRGRFR